MANTTRKFGGSSNWGDIRNTVNIIAGKDLLSYTLFFIDAAENYPVGDYITINNENISIGRDDSCKITYGENHPYISRNQCSIFCEGQKIVLKHNFSAKNPTIINGVEATFDHELRNGDELQLAYNGPKLRFNKTESKLASAGITDRVRVAISQATKPLKVLIYTLAFLVLFLLGLTSYATVQFFSLQKDKDLAMEQMERIVQEKYLLDSLLQKTILEAGTNQTEIENLRKRIRQNRRQLASYRSKNTPSSKNNPVKNENNDSEPASPSDIAYKEDDKNANVSDNPKGGHSFTLDNLPVQDMYLIKATKVEIDDSCNDNNPRRTIDAEWLLNTNFIRDKKAALWTGAGFLTKNMGLMTARHVIQPWKYFDVESNLFFKLIIVAESLNLNPVVSFEATCVNDPNKKIQFTSSSNIRFPKASTSRQNIARGKLQECPQEQNSFSITKIDPSDYKSDLAFINTTKKGSYRLSPSNSFPSELPFYALGVDFNQTQFNGRKTNYIGRTKKEYKRFKPEIVNLKPKLETFFTSSSIPANQGKCINISENLNISFGKSGGPAFVEHKGELYLIGIIPDSRTAPNCIVHGKI